MYNNGVFKHMELFQENGIGYLAINYKSSYVTNIFILSKNKYKNLKFKHISIFLILIIYFFNLY